MTLQQIIDLVRRRQGNYEPPYIQVDAELVDYANEVVNHIARETFIIKDSSTPAICYLTLTADTIDYSFDQRILEIKSASISGYNSAVTQTGSGLSDLSICGNYTEDDTNTSFVVYCDTSGTTDTFKWSNDGGSTWEATGVSMTGDWQELDHGMWIKFAATTGHTADDYWSWTTYPINGGLLTRMTTNELYEGQSTWRKGTSGEPTRFVTDYIHSYISFYVPPQYSYLVNMRVTRYPLSQLTSASMSSQTPEIPINFHYAIVEGILAQAYLRRGAETFDDRKASIHQAIFDKEVQKMKRYNINLQGYSRNLRPDDGIL